MRGVIISNARTMVPGRVSYEGFLSPHGVYVLTNGDFSQW